MYAWLNSEFPGITELAKAENTEIFFGDETNIQNTANFARGYAPKGKIPVVQALATKLKIEMLLAISKRGKLHFVLYSDSMNSKKMIDIMKRITSDSTKNHFQRPTLLDYIIQKQQHCSVSASIRQSYFFCRI